MRSRKELMQSASKAFFVGDSFLVMKILLEGILDVRDLLLELREQGPAVKFPESPPPPEVKT